MDREHTCCFTGHRPDKLPWGADEKREDCLALKARLVAALERAYTAGCRHFICGMARGADLYFAEAVLDLRAQHDDVTLEAARPCETQADSWPQTEKARYYTLLDQCNLETLVQHHYDRGCMARRNRYMVDHAARLIAVYDGIPKGGTAQTLAYAMKQNLELDILELT
ncbi:MAG: DUF1273 family protein [Clostridium sp.]|nr:DUF1273 family protein [Clostridium sp.]